MVEKLLANHASEPFGNGPALLAIGDMTGQANGSSSPIPIEVAA